MKLLHLMIKEKFTKGITQLYNNYFNNGVHTICYVRKATEPSLVDPQLTIDQIELISSTPIGNAVGFIKLIKCYDYIVLHSLRSLQSVSPLLYLLPSYTVQRKLIWIEWGADLYYFGDFIKSRIRNHIKKNIYAYIAIFPPDIEEYRRQFPNSKAITYYAPYVSGRIANPTPINRYMAIQSRRHKDDGEIIIQVGHNAMPTLCHKEVLFTLKKYAGENIKVFLPLNYGGEQKYVNEVAGIARELFGEKAYILDSFMDQKEYMRLLDSVDIAIFNTHRQAGLGNINRLLSNRVKIYMPSDTVMYDFFRAQGFNICAIEQIANESFGDFVSPSEPLNAEKVYAYLTELSEPAERIRYWENIYEDLRRKKTD